MKLGVILIGCVFLSEVGISQNLVVNGDFESGNTNFSSDYVQDCPNDKLPADIGSWHEGAPADGQYCVTTPFDWSQTGTNQLGNWFPVDQSPENGVTGNMLHVNGNVTTNSKIWCQTINDIAPNSQYKFSTWISTIFAPAGNVAELQFSINGTNFGELITADPTPGEWDLFFEVWDSQANESAEICIVNQNTTSNGNDFVLDNIKFELLSFSMPNIFTPDGDNLNDVFTPINFAGISKYKLSIYNRWGLEMATITESEMATPQWNGKNNNKGTCSSGVYFWTIEYEVGIGTETIIKKNNGYVHLVKSN